MKTYMYILSLFIHRPIDNIVCQWCPRLYMPCRISKHCRRCMALILSGRPLSLARGHVPPGGSLDAFYLSVFYFRTHQDHKAHAQPTIKCLDGRITTAYCFQPKTKAVKNGRDRSLNWLNDCQRKTISVMWQKETSWKLSMSTNSNRKYIIYLVEYWQYLKLTP